MEEQLTSLKQALRSLVVSSPTTMTVKSLLKDYRNMVGGALPFTKFGYKDPITFLKERCSDVFVLEGPQWDPILTPKITENLKHIDKMVQKQKVQSGAKFKGKRRSVPGSFPSNETNVNPKYETRHRIYETVPPTFRETNIVAPIQIVAPNVKEKITNNHNTTNNYTKEKNENSNYQNKHYHNTDNQNVNEKITHNQNGYKTDQNETHNTSYYKNNNDVENDNYSSVEELRPNSALSKFYKKRLPRYNSDMDFSSSETDHVSKESADSGRQTLSSNSSSKQARLEELKSEILALIRDSVEGVWCTDLVKLYKETYGRELVYSCFGYTNLISLVCSMHDRVLITRPAPSGDWLLQDPRTAEAPAGAGAGPDVRVRRTARGPLQHEPPVDHDSDDALPGVDFEPDVFPEDSLHYLEAVPSARRATLDAGTQAEVLVGEVYSPSHFWLLRVGPDHNLAMEQLMDEMTAYYCAGGAGTARQLARGAVRVGQYCAALYERDWHRSLIVAIVDSETVKVRHIDYGTVESVPVSGLKPLLRAWSCVPAQAVRARLAGVAPAAGGRRWPRAAAAWLLHRVRDKRLYANVVAVDDEEDIIEVFLTDTSSDEDVCLTRELIRAGHADRRYDSALHRDECYLYPRFEALETGATPNYADICRILADGIALDYVEAYRRHVPGPWTRARSPRPPPSPRPSPSPRPPPSPPAPHALPPPLELLNRVPLLRLDSPPASPPANAAPTERWLPRPTDPPPTPSPEPVAYVPASSVHVPLSTPQTRTPFITPQSRAPLFQSPQTRAPLLPTPQTRVPLFPTPQTRAPLLPTPQTRAPFYPTPQIHASQFPTPQTPFLQGSVAPHLQPPVGLAPPLVRGEVAMVPRAEGSEHGLEMQLSESEWAVLSHLRALDPAAAHWYLLSTAWRSMLAPPPGF